MVIDSVVLNSEYFHLTADQLTSATILNFEVIYYFFNYILLNGMRKIAIRSINFNTIRTKPIAKTICQTVKSGSQYRFKTLLKEEGSFRRHNFYLKIFYKFRE